MNPGGGASATDVPGTRMVWADSIAAWNRMIATQVIIPVVFLPVTWIP
jgi:hypothetical protein